MYEDLIKRLKNCTSDTVEDCAGCPYQGGYKGTYCMNGLIAEAADAIEELSKERKTGEWCADYDYAEYDFDGSTPLQEPRKFQDGWQCSLCGGYSPSETNFCPNCGAKMSGGDEDEEPPKEET